MYRAEEEKMARNHSATSESMKPLMNTHNDSALGFITDDDPPTYKETTLTSTPMKGSESVKIAIEDTQSSSSASVDLGSSSLISNLTLLHSKMEDFFKEKQKIFMKSLLVVLAVAYLAYFIYALYLDATRQCETSAVPLIVVTIIALVFIVFRYINNMFGDNIRKFMKVIQSAIKRKWHILKWVALFLVYGGMLALIVYTVWEVPSNLVSLVGIITFIIVLFLLSSSPTQVRWRPVLGGFTLQFYFAVLILKWDIGYRVFYFLGKEIQKFLAFTDFGSKFVFGDKYTDHIFAMKVLPVIIFFSCFISILYYLGTMQFIIGNIAFVMKSLLGTTAAESLCAAGNIFVGQTEAPILIRPYLNVMTRSELHAVMVGGFATIAGSVLAAYVSFGVPAEHLLCASVMNAPCALAVSKLLHPETETSKLEDIDDLEQEDNDNKPRNFLEAAAAGASTSICLVANITANLIAFLALLAFVNAVLSWFGAFVCFPQLSFEKICSYVFMPVAYLMGVEWKDAGVVGELVGIKTFLNEFVAYKELAKFITNREDCKDGTTISRRSEIIATYALCGFSNLSSIGIQLGGLGPMAPKRVKDLAQIVIRALFGGIVACLMTASIAGLLMADHSASSNPCINNATAINITSNSVLNDTSYSVLNDTIPMVFNMTLS
ncbi:solute carrier family 28 member 3-like isoform X2 [Haliotis rufescens]|uniref:solute carrier family 28 member 3-like isoform X2 n=1 Tax=Haliotis rufescens TaxID=6454 RepID=UPI00201F47A8|nr:solute carrier family 28 member 3-like isoform X2 [Haliotis rufescens]